MNENWRRCWKTDFYGALFDINVVLNLSPHPQVTQKWGYIPQLLGLRRPCGAHSKDVKNVEKNNKKRKKRHKKILQKALTTFFSARLMNVHHPPTGRHQSSHTVYSKVQ
jgi:hypothetical protein